MKRVIPGTLAAVMLAACTGGTQPTTSASPQVAPEVTLLGQNVTLLPGEGRAVRIGFEAAGPTADVIVRARPDAVPVLACPLQSVDSALPQEQECETLASGVRQTVSGSGMRAVGFVPQGTGAVNADITLIYAEAGRRVSLRLPLIAAPPGASACKDNGCNPFFEVRPARAGSFRAESSWTGGAGTLVLLQGRVLGRSFTATGVPYREAARADGSSPLTIRARAADAEYALVFRHADANRSDVADIRIEADWP